MTKVVELFGRRVENGRSACVRNTAEASGSATEGIFGGERGIGEVDSTDDKAKALAEMVLDHREGWGLSQREFASESGVSRTILSKIEQGELYPGGKVRRKLAAAMGRSPVDLWWIGGYGSDETEGHHEGFTNPEQRRNKEAS